MNIQPEIKKNTKFVKQKEISTDKSKLRNSLSNSPFCKLNGRCYRCGDQNHRANICRYKDEICHSCKKVGHLARVCMKGSYQNNFDQDQNEDHERAFQFFQRGRR